MTPKSDMYSLHTNEQYIVHFEQILLRQTMKIGDDTTAQTCAHVCNISHYIDSKKVCCKAK